MLPKVRYLALTAALPVALLGAGISAPALAASCPWIPAWGSSQMQPDGDNALPAEARSDVTLRQIVRTSIGGSGLRVRLSNAFGDTPLVIEAATLARAPHVGKPGIDTASLTPLRFSGKTRVVIPPGSDWLSDPVDLPVKAFEDLAISLHVEAVPQRQTSHPGARTTSYWIPGDHVREADLPTAKTMEHWFLLSGIEAHACGTGAVVALGDSITDGRGTTTNGNDRWTDVLARRLGGKRSVINQGIGGNRVLLDGLGPNAMARLDRDVLALPGVSHLIVLEGINDLGNLTREHPATAEQHAAMVEQITGAYAQIVARAHAHGIKVYGGTLLPFMGMEFYHPIAANEADRQAVNSWIRTPGHFDAVIDFDKVMRDPARPDHLNPAYDSGDAIHPNPAGYKAMGEAVPLELLR
ncbi:lysophospholipase L1-like esterase [Novosphingobium sp. PhB165]|uniref:SGNH/GDSL hydrolase family protein n=1 Tax=Novosphingobium sp. PhB165 TaxID=2485105 RepID=UPI0010539A8C|nr:SGNH/GDSL hydrolase family protein [Novosphingobium sp. PhB165]TCM20515.1 lysophospholipase L1-like esterase [Novosphingobium sp. PhB165]